MIPQQKKLLWRADKDAILTLVNNQVNPQPINLIIGGEVLFSNDLIIGNGFSQFPISTGQEVYAWGGDVDWLIDGEEVEIVWDKDAYAEAINAAHSEWYRKIYTRKPDLDYGSIGEIGLYLNHPDFGAQAQALQQLWWHSVEILYAHLGTVTEETAKPIEAFINSLPKFNH